jgi:hypothetical protein
VIANGLAKPGETRVAPTMVLEAPSMLTGALHEA